MTRWWIVGVLLLATAGTAHAGPAAIARRLLATECKALAADGLGSDYATVERTFTDDAFAFLNRGVSSDHDGLRDQLGEAFLDDDTATETCKVRAVHAGALGGDAIWLSAQLVLTGGGMGVSGVYDWTEDLTALVVRDGKHWRIRAAHIASPVANDATTAAADPVPGAADDADHAALLASPAKLADALATDPAVIVIGSAGERALGPAKAKALLTRWSKLTFTVDGGVRWTAGPAWTYAAANLTAAQAHYRLLVLFDGSGDVVAVQYSATD